MLYLNNSIKLVFFALSLIIVSACKKPAPASPVAAPVPVNTYEVKSEAATSFQEFPGTIVPLNEVQLRSEVNGYLTGIFFKDGQFVKKGQKLYEIDRSKYTAAFAQAEANHQIAKANLERTQRDADRYSKLGEQEAIAKQKVEYALTDLQNANLQFVAAQAQLTSARNDLQHATIVAPFDGTIGISLVKLGSFINGGQTHLNTISSDNPVAVDFVVSEKDIYHFLQLQKTSSGAQDSTFSLILPDRSVFPAPGKISMIDRAVDPQTGTLKIRLIFANNENTLRSGMSGNVRVKNYEGDGTILIPQKAVTEQMGEFFVFKVMQDTARQQKVTLGSKVADKIIIREGLNAGEKIVLDGIQKLKEGSVITTVPASASAANQSPTK